MTSNRKYDYRTGLNEHSERILSRGETGSWTGSTMMGSCISESLE